MFNPKYTISDNLVNKLSQIAEIKALVEKSRLLPKREVFLRRAAIIKMAHSSTSIEGNQLKEYEVARLTEGKSVNAEERQVKEVKNYLAALRAVDKLSDTKTSFNTDNILKLHKVVVEGLIDKEKAGIFRPGPVYLVNVTKTGEERLAYTPPPARQVPQLVKDLVGWLNKNHQIHPIVRAGLFHYQFETIHPFVDGNGRLGRLLTLLHLYQSGWDFKKILVLEDYYNQNRKGYYKALQTGHTYKARLGVPLHRWLEYYVEGFLSEALKVKDQILSLSVIKDVNKGKTMLDKDELRIVDFVVTMGQIRSSDVCDILNVPKRTAQLKLKRLEDMQILQKMGAGPATYYIIHK